MAESTELQAQEDPLKAALKEYLAIPGMQAALLVSDQGLVISRAALDGVDTASVAALAIDTVATVQRFGLQVQAGYLDTMRIEFDKLTVVLAPFALRIDAGAGGLGRLIGGDVRETSPHLARQPQLKPGRLRPRRKRDSQAPVMLGQGGVAHRHREGGGVHHRSQPLGGEQSHDHNRQ